MKMPCLPNKLYDWLKWIAIAFIPGIAMAYSVLAGIWGWPCASQVSQTANCLGTLLAVLIGASSVSYSISNKSYTINNSDSFSETNDNEDLTTEDEDDDNAPNGG